MLGRFTSFHSPVSVVGKSSCLTRVWCYRAQGFCCPFRAGRDKKISQGKPWAMLSWPFRPQTEQTTIT